MQRKTAKKRSNGGSQSPSIHADRAQQRRAQYASDEAAATDARRQQREKYQPVTAVRGAPKLGNGLLARGERREVITGEMDHPELVETFTVPQAAEALGRSVSTLRRWIEADRVPSPYLREIGRASCRERVL